MVHKTEVVAQLAALARAGSGASGAVRPTNHRLLIDTQAIRNASNSLKSNDEIFSNRHSSGPHSSVSCSSPAKLTDTPCRVISHVSYRKQTTGAPFTRHTFQRAVARIRQPRASRFAPSSHWPLRATRLLAYQIAQGWPENLASSPRRRRFQPESRRLRRSLRAGSG